MLTDDRYDQDQIDLAYNDFKYFLYIVWDYISLPQPTEVQIDMAHTLANPPSDRIIIEGFRGVAKSFITCALVVWLLWKNPILKIQSVSANGEKAGLNAGFIKKIIMTIPFLACLRLTAEDKRAGLRDGNQLFDVHGALPDISPSVKSVGITGQLTGSRADVLISDDCEVPANSATQLQRSRLAELVKEFDSILKPKGRIIYLGTPQCEASLYVELGNRGYTTITYPVEYPRSAEQRAFYGNGLGNILKKRYDADPKKWAGKPTDPQRFDEDEIDKRKLSYGKAGFALQFMLNTNLSDAEKFPLRVADLIVTALDSEESSMKWNWANSKALQHADVPCTALKGDFFYEAFDRSKEVSKYTGCMMFIDPSGRGKDETAYAITKFLNGYIFVMEVGGFKDGYSDATLKTLAMKAKYHKVNEVRIEPNYGDGMFTKLITPVFTEIYPCNVEEARSATGQKEARIIDILEPTMSRHKLIFDINVLMDDYEVYQKDPDYSLVYQITRLTKDRNSLGHDDRVEALAGAVLHWIESMSVVDQEGVNERAEELLEMWMDEDRGIFYKEEEVLRPTKKQSIRDLMCNMIDSFWKD